MNKHIVLTGIWLGLVQTGLGYAVLVGAGSSILLFFATLTAWIAGGALGATLKTVRLRPLLLAAGIAAIAATANLTLYSFNPSAAALGLAAGALVGVFAGRFIAFTGIELQDARRVLFLENNGFITGLTLGLVLLFVEPLSIAAIAGLLWAGLLFMD